MVPQFPNFQKTWLRLYPLRKVRDDVYHLQSSGILQHHVKDRRPWSVVQQLGTLGGILHDEVDLLKTFVGFTIVITIHLRNENLKRKSWTVAFIIRVQRDSSIGNDLKKDLQSLQRRILQNSEQRSLNLQTFESGFHRPPLATSHSCGQSRSEYERQLD